MWKVWLSKNWKRLLAILICIVFLLDHQIWHKIQFDAITISLIILITVLLVLPNPQIIFPYIKRIKLWEAEIELKEEIKELGKEIEKAQEAAANKTSSATPQTSSSDETAPDRSGNQPNNVEDVLIAAGKDPRAALLLLASKIELEIKKRLQEADIPKDRYKTVSRGVIYGAERGVFSDEVVHAFRDFWNVRNRVAHAEAFDVDDKTILSLISLGTELLKVISTEKAS